MKVKTPVRLAERRFTKKNDPNNMFNGNVNLHNTKSYFMFC